MNRIYGDDKRKQYNAGRMVLFIQPPWVKPPYTMTNMAVWLRANLIRT